jgi:predicted phage baseplate assembly protein
MPIPLPSLDDRKFSDLMAEMKALIPRYAPGWTDHNVSDPGITLVELFAWLTEALIYRLNRVPQASEVRFLELLGATFQSAQPATAMLTVTADGLASKLPVLRERTTRLRDRLRPGTRAG